MRETRPIRRGRPEFAETQRDEVLRDLRAAGPDGVSRATFIFEKKITQCGARADELKRMDYVIRSELREGERYVRYVLVSEPAEPKRLPASQRRPSQHEKISRQLEAEAMPLFAGVRDRETCP